MAGGDVEVYAGIRFSGLFRNVVEMKEITGGGAFPPLFLPKHITSGDSTVRSARPGRLSRFQEGAGRAEHPFINLTAGT